jgi:hypothetical protein
MQLALDGCCCAVWPRTGKGLAIQGARCPCSACHSSLAAGRALPTTFWSGLAWLILIQARYPAVVAAAATVQAVGVQQASMLSRPTLWCWPNAAGLLLTVTEALMQALI